MTELHNTLTLCDACIKVLNGTAKHVWCGSEEDDGCYELAGHMSIGSFLDAIQSKCTICVRIWRYYNFEGPITEYRTISKAHSLDIDIQYETPVVKVKISECVENDKSYYFEFMLNQDIVGPLRSLKGMPEKTGRTWLSFHVVNVKDMPGYDPSKYVTWISSLPKVEESHAISSTGSLEAMDLAKRWVRDCQSHEHPQDQKESQHASRPGRLVDVDVPQPAWMPTRLVDIEVPDRSSNFRVVNTAEQGITAPYLTLSHRWGQADVLKL